MAGYIGSKASVVSSGAERKKTFAITTTTTVLTGLSYTPTFVHLFHNGVRLVDGTDYTATDGTSITLTSAAESGDEVVVISYATFQAADAYTKAEADSAFVSDPNGAVTVDASGNVGIGTASPARGPLHLNAASGSAEMHMTTTGNGTASTDGLTIFAGESVGSAGAGVWYRENGPLRFATNATEAMRLDTSGRLLVNTTTHDGSSISSLNRAGEWCLSLQDVVSNQALIKFKNPGAATVGTVTHNGSSTQYNTTSDYRLKENITPIQGAGDIVKAMQPVTYTFKSDGSWMDGFIAHELQELHPSAVTGEKDAVDEDGNPEYQGVDYSKLTPILTAALQEALNKIDALEARLTALEAV